MTKLKVAIAGCGRISVSYADAFKKLADEIEVVYAVDKVPEKAREFLTARILRKYTGKGSMSFTCVFRTIFMPRWPSTRWSMESMF